MLGWRLQNIKTLNVHKHNNDVLTSLTPYSCQQPQNICEDVGRSRLQQKMVRFVRSVLIQYSHAMRRETKSTVLFPCKYESQGSAEANVRVQLFEIAKSNRYSGCGSSMWVYCCCLSRQQTYRQLPGHIPLLQPGKNTVHGNTQREFCIKKTEGLEDIYLSYVTQTADAPF